MTLFLARLFSSYAERLLVCWVITLRSVKGSALTHAELDANFTTLRDVASQTSGTLSGITSLTMAGAIVGATSQDVFNTVSTTVNAFGAATTLNLGAATGTATINNAIVSITGGNLKFPATAVPSADANTLDDYEEYTSASTACSGALTVSVAWRLTKIGNKVTLHCPNVTGTASNVAELAYGLTIPAAYRPVADAVSGSFSTIVNGVGVAGLGLITVGTDGVITLFRDGTQALAWGTAANTGMLYAADVTWLL